MRLRTLAVVLLLSGCQRSAPPEPVSGPERPPSSAKGSDAIPASQEAADEPQPSAADELPAPSEPTPSLADELPDQTWSARSADGRAEVRQTALRHGKTPRCMSTSTVSPPWDGPSVMWKWDTCIATREHLKFVSPDGKRVLVLDPLPAPLRGNWRDVEVATLYEHGVRIKGAKAETLVTAPIEVREPSLGFTWVKGQAGHPGAPPRYTSDGRAVEFETVDGHAFRLGFEGEGFPTPPEEQHVFVESAGMYRYEDEKGTVHIVGSPSELPARYRSRAVPVESRVGMLTVSGPLGGGEQPPPSDPGSKGSLESARVPAPAELLNQAREAVKKLEASQHEREKLMDALPSESPSPAR